MTLSYEETKLLYQMAMLGIENGNRAEGKPFDPTPEQYRMLCGIANRSDEYIKRMQAQYGLDAE